MIAAMLNHSSTLTVNCLADVAVRARGGTNCGLRACILQRQGPAPMRYKRCTHRYWLVLQRCESEPCFHHHRSNKRLELKFGAPIRLLCHGYHIAGKTARAGAKFRLSQWAACQFPTRISLTIRIGRLYRRGAGPFQMDLNTLI